MLLFHFSGRNVLPFTLQRYDKKMKLPNLYAINWCFGRKSLLLTGLIRIRPFWVYKYEKAEVVKNFDRLNKLKYSTVEPTAFTQRGLYMLATIIKSPRATNTTLAIVDTFVNVRELAQTMEKLQWLWHCYSVTVKNTIMPKFEKYYIFIYIL